MKMVIIDSVTRQRVSRAPHSGDIEYNLFSEDGDTAITEEVVPVIGKWTDDIPGLSATGGPESNIQQQFAGISNELFGTDAELEGGFVPELDETGNNKQTTRRRVIRRYVKC